MGIGRKITSILLALSFGCAPIAFAGTSSANDRLSEVNNALDMLESGELRGNTLAQQYGQEIVPASQGAVISDGMKEAFKISGEIRIGFGINSDGKDEWSKADGNLNERNWRLLNYQALNNAENTYDPGIYSRLKLVIDAAVGDAVSMHLNAVADPWSYTGKTETQTVTGSWGNDTADVQYLYWGNSGYTIGRIIKTKNLGEGFALPETKVKSNEVPAQTIRSSWGDNFAIPAMKVDYTFQPIRELWFDLKPGDKGTIRIFPMAYEDQALTSDDPLKLSNNRMYWEESPWVRDWKPGNFNDSATPVPSFTKGKWDRAIANMSHDSDGTRLTALRGVSMDLKLDDDSYIKAVAATPKNLWQEYSTVTAVPGSVRWKQFLADGLFVGMTDNMHIGFANNDEVDAVNYVKSVDAGLVPVEGVEINAQVSSSTTESDKTTPRYETHKRGNAYYASLEMTTNPEDVLKKDYYGIVAPKGAETFAKTRFYYGEMEDGFESSLSNYHETRDDSFWSRHLTFYPSPYRNLPGSSTSMSEYDVLPFAIGDGLDYGRKVFAWRGDAELLEGRLKGMGDSRYVMTSDGDKIEAVSRTAWEYQATEKLLAKTLLLHHDLPATTAGKDPFIVSGETGLPVTSYTSSGVLSEGGQDPSLNTGTLGLRYQATDWLAWNGVWERTNDFTLGADNFPQGLLNESNYETYTENGQTYSRDLPFIYSQGYFDQAPYAYHNVWKTGVELKPTDQWDFYIDYARNPNKFAGNIDDNYNHIGLEASYVPNDKLGFFSRYTFSRQYEMDKLVNQHELDYRSYNNFFFETRYCRNKNSKLAVLYGVGPSYNIGVQGVNPSLSYYSTPVMDIEHIIRVIYQQKF